MLRRLIAIKQVPWLVLVVSLIATVAVWFHTRTDVLEVARVRFHAHAEGCKDRIIERMRDYEMALRGGVGLFDASDEVSRDSWRAYIQALHIERNFPGTQGVGFSKRIHPQGKASHVLQVRAEGFPEYSIRPGGERSEYTSILFLEPFSGRNLRAFGYDMFSEAVRRATMERARDEGIPTLSGKVILVQETDKDKQNGILMYVPVYRRGMPNGNVEERRAALTGYVYSPLRLNDLMVGILGKAVGETDIVLYDGKEETSGSLLYANGAEKTAAKERGKFRSVFTETLTFDQYGRTWTIRFGSLSPFEARIDTGQPLYVLLGGVGTSLFLFGATFALALRYKALAKIKEVEEALRQEIVQRKQAEEELRSSKEELIEAQRVGGVGNWSLDPKTGKVIWSEELFRIFGRDPGLPPPNYEEHMEIFPPESLEKENAAIEKCMQCGESYELDLEFIRPDGTRGWIITSGEAKRDENGRIVGLRGTAQDITERKRAEEEKRTLEQQVQQTQKLESLGVLAGGIAHDFNNLLMVVLGHAELASQEISPISPAHGNLTEITTAARRAADLSLQMLTYAGKAVFTVERVGLRELVEEMAPLLKIAISKKTILSLNLERGLPPIKADSSQIRQIVMNLIINASEAIEDRSGVITVSVAATRCDEEHPQYTEQCDDLPPGLYVHLEVTDTGIGMDEKTRARIFEPFFSTKFTGRGLGLSAVLGIVRAHKGALKVYSEPGRGTTFKVLFPAMEDAGKEARTNESRSSSPLADWRGKRSTWC